MIFSNLHFTGNNKFDLLLLLDFKKYGEPDFIKQLSELKSSYGSRNFRGKTIYEAVLGNAKKINIAFVNEIGIISSTASLCEDAVAQLMGRNNLLEDKSFSDLLKPLPEKFAVTVFFNYKKLSDFISNYSNTQAPNYLTALSSIADWSAFDLQFISFLIRS